MAYQLRRKESVEEALRRIAREEIDQALAEISSQELTPDQSVHQVRKRCKKVRSLLRLVRPAFKSGYSQANARFRDAARSLSWVRDADILHQTLEKLVQRYPNRLNDAAAAPVLAALEQYRRRVQEKAGDLPTLCEQFAAMMYEARRDVETWTLSEDEFAAIGPGLKKIYRRGRAAMKTAYADPTSENFHTWRKRAKDHGYHLRLLRGVWKSEMQTRQAAVDDLLELLGQDHDLAVLHDLVARGELRLAEEFDYDTTPLLKLLDRRRAELQKMTHPWGLRLYAETPSCLTGRWEAYWRIWRKHGPARFHTSASN